MAVEIAEEFDLGKADSQHQALQFLSRVKRVMELEPLRPVALDENPLVADARPVVEDFMYLNQQCAVEVAARVERLHGFGHPFLAKYVNEANAALLEAGEDVAQYEAVFVLVIEVAERFS